jgi:flagellar hook protein FlgE
MDVIGNNIANVNTVGFKASRVIFQDIYSQTLTPASGPDVDSGGRNPIQVGLGMSLATVDVLHTKSAAQYTGADLDLSVEGDGFFTVSDGGALYYTRAGNLYTDKDNNLVTSGGDFVQGYQVDAAGNLVLDAFGDPIMQNIVIDPAYYDVTISSNGAIVGLNKTTNAEAVLGQIILANFANQNALEKTGSNTYRNSINSGDAVYNIPGSGGTGTLNPGTLEMTNVDLANEFTDMIVTQRGFQANSRIITTSDSMLEELVNLKR